MKLLSLSLAILASASFLTGQEREVSLAGEWKFALDRNDLGLAAGADSWSFPDTIKLPGSTAAQGKGDALEITLNLEKPAMQHLHQRHPYLGPAWYQREVTIPTDWAGSDIVLTLERVLWESRIWVDGTAAGDPQNSLSVPHRYDLGSLLKPGQTHTLTLRVDNRAMVDIGKIGHAYTEETQTIWNGVIGDLKLEALPKVRVSHLALQTNLAKKTVSVTVETTNTSEQARDLALALQATSPTGSVIQKTLPQIRLNRGTQTHEIELPINEQTALWSEHQPQLWTLSASLGNGQPFTREVGFRSFAAEGRNLTINGQATFLRGNLECAIFPQTGHPDAEGSQWQKIMQVSKDYGLNHLRFHSWCPPEAAFAAADRAGIYLQVELPNWTFEMGQNAPVDAFFQTEGERLIREYGHHPSFVLFSLGNELKGDLKAMDALLAHFRTLAPDLLFTSTSYAFSPRGLLPGEEDDFFISQNTKSGWVRGQGFLNNTFPTTNSDYAEGLACLEIPLVTHEVGQYVVYPRLAELPKYEGTPLRSTALESIQIDLTEKGMLAEADRLTRDSGKLAALLYKEDIERALRTKGLAGIQLLQLQDFPGQSTASVGLLDAFWDSKGLIEPEDFRRFCAPTVPLARMERFVWENSETFRAELELAHFGEKPLPGAFTASLVNSQGEVVAQQVFPERSYPLGNGHRIGSFSAALDSIAVATQLQLQVSHPSGAANSWPVWVYPRVTPPAAESKFVTHQGVSEECLADLQAGKRVLLLPLSGTVKKPLPARFIPVFWSPLHFPNQPGTLGASIDTTHPLWKDFPTDTHTNWQWWELTAESVSVDLAGYDGAIAAPFRFVDKYDRNAQAAAIFEARVGTGSVLVCTLDLEPGKSSAQGLVKRELKRSLEKYLNSESFRPAGSLSEGELKALFGAKEFTLTASASHPDYPSALAGDGQAATIWHSPWDASARLPVSLQLDLLAPKGVQGLRYTPRQDSPRGRIQDYQLQISPDGKRWKDYGKQASFPNNGTPVELRFPQPIKVQFLRLLIMSEHGGSSYAACAELAPIYPPAGDARDLGIIPGFNELDSSEQQTK